MMWPACDDSLQVTFDCVSLVLSGAPNWSWLHQQHQRLPERMCSPSSGGKPTQVAFLVVIVFHSANEDGVVVKVLGLFSLWNRGSILWKPWLRSVVPSRGLLVCPFQKPIPKQNKIKIQNMYLLDFPGGPVVETLHFPCREKGFDPWSGN